VASTVVGRPRAAGWLPGRKGAYGTPVPAKPGLSAEVDLLVSDDDTAIAMKSGDVPVLATPRVIALCEEAAVKALIGELAPSETSVGMQVQLDHLAPTAVGHTVIAEATVEKVSGRRVTFTVSVTDERGLVAVGRVTRVIVDIDRFLEKAKG
jgi:fluoroacetyl-CoA thioesterase